MCLSSHPLYFSGNKYPISQLRFNAEAYNGYSDLAPQYHVLLLPPTPKIPYNHDCQAPFHNFGFQVPTIIPIEVLYMIKFLEISPSVKSSCKINTCSMKNIYLYVFMAYQMRHM